MKKDDLKHLSRKELIDLICEIEKTNLLVDVEAAEAGTQVQVTAQTKNQRVVQGT